VLGQERAQIMLGDANHTPKPMRHQDPGVDPAPNRPGRDFQQLGDLRDGKKFRDSGCLTRAHERDRLSRRD
jgi:hypothetical protein